MNFINHTSLLSGFAAEQADLVCWSRMQAEAGQALETIIARKELERRSTGGLFFWGVGNAPSRQIPRLVRSRVPVKAIFSKMKSRPKAQDVSPAAICLWRAYIDVDGKQRPLPPTSVVTSRAESPSGGKRAHYALVCRSPQPLALDQGVATFDPTAFRNAGDGGRSVGASQVTALLRQITKPAENGTYEVNMEAELAGSYWVRLADPLPVAAELQHQIDAVEDLTLTEWCGLAQQLRSAVSQPSQG